MTAFAPQPNETLREARARYFEANQFGLDGRYDQKTVKITIGPLKIPIPNTKGRVRAVRFHDLHHVLTEYDTDLRGEAEIAAWEIASGCADHYAAWVLNFGAMGIGAVLIPRRTWQAFVRGRHTKNLYRETFDDKLLDSTVAEMRAKLDLDKPLPEKTSAEDVGTFTAAMFAATMTATALGLLKTPIAGVLLLASAAYRLNEVKPEPVPAPVT